MFSIQLLLIFCHYTIVDVAKFQIDGRIDFGPKMHYKLHIAQVTEGILNLALRKGDITNFIENVSSLNAPPRSNRELNIQNNKIRSKIDTNDSHFKAEDAFMTRINISVNIESVEDGNGTKWGIEIPIHRAHRDSPLKIKDDESVQKYFKHLHNRALKFLDALREKNKMSKSNFHRAKHMYRDKIHEFIVNMENQTLRTKLGRQKAILNTLDVSNKIVNKLLDRMGLHSKSSQSLRNEISSANAVQKGFSVDEFIHICNEYNICRTGRSFSDFTAEILSMILRTDDRSVKQASDALTEVIKDVKFPKIMDWESQKKFKSAIENLELIGALETRVVFTVLKNMIANRNKPIKIYGNENMVLVNKTVAFQTILSEFDTVIPGNEENVKIWDNLLNNVREWMNGDRGRIQNMFNKLLRIVQKAVVKMTDDSAQIIRKNIHFIFI